MDVHSETAASADAVQGFSYMFKSSDVTIQVNLGTSGPVGGVYSVTGCTGSITIKGQGYSPVVPGGVFQLYATAPAGDPCCAGIDSNTGISFGPRNASLSYNGTGQSFDYSDPIAGNFTVDLVSSTFPTA